MDTFFLLAKENLMKDESILSNYACKYSDAIRLKNEEEHGIRPSFKHDADRILYSLSYNRYLDKTQVFTNSHNDHISKRMNHVQFVSSISQFIGGSLLLNKQLIEAIALGHDIGHTPLGHFGESVLNDISLEALNEHFLHNIQSVRNLMYVENNGNGLNLSIQTLDGIMCHNGKITSHFYELDRNKTVDDFFRQYQSGYTNPSKSQEYHPMTLEGCVVRFADMIAYLGRDIEDAIRLGRLNKEDIPKNISNVLGDTNAKIIDTLNNDIIRNSLKELVNNHLCISLSEEVLQAMLDLKQFNYDYIYQYSMTDDLKEYYRDGMHMLFDKYLYDLESDNKKSSIYSIFLNEQKSGYIENNSIKRIVIDYIAGMTDDFFINEVKSYQKCLLV